MEIRYLVICTGSRFLANQWEAMIISRAPGHSNQHRSQRGTGKAVITAEKDSDAGGGKKGNMQLNRSQG